MTAAPLHGLTAGYQSLYELADTCGCSITHWEPKPTPTPAAAAAASSGAASCGAASAGRLEFDVQEAMVSCHGLMYKHSAGQAVNIVAVQPTVLLA
jgi:hypothetical protein